MTSDASSPEETMESILDFLGQFFDKWPRSSQFSHFMFLKNSLEKLKFEGEDNLMCSFFEFWWMNDRPQERPSKPKYIKWYKNRQNSVLKLKIVKKLR